MKDFLSFLINDHLDTIATALLIAAVMLGPYYPDNPLVSFDVALAGLVVILVTMAVFLGMQFRLWQREQGEHKVTLFGKPTSKSEVNVLFCKEDEETGRTYCFLESFFKETKQSFENAEELTEEKKDIIRDLNWTPKEEDS